MEYVKETFVNSTQPHKGIPQQGSNVNQSGFQNPSTSQIVGQQPQMMMPQQQGMMQPQMMGGQQGATIIKETYIKEEIKGHMPQMMGGQQQGMMQPQMSGQQGLGGQELPIGQGTYFPPFGSNINNQQPINRQEPIVVKIQQPLVAQPVSNIAYCPVECQEMACPMECTTSHKHHSHNEKHKHHHGIFHRRDEDICGSTTNNTTYCPVECQELACPLDCTTSHKHHTHNEKHKHRGGLFNRKEKDTY